MATWKKDIRKRENGEDVEMQLPEIVSASRSTDIPAFYADWFFHRLKKGYSAWINPFNGVRGYVSYENTRFIIFWSKNPRPLLEHLHELRVRNIGCYIQYTLNDYENERLELGVPPLDERIETFKLLVKQLGGGHVIWRFDPLILTDKINIDLLLKKIEYIGNKLFGYTEKLIFSFADIASYKKVKSNLGKNGINYIEWNDALMNEFAKRLSELNKKWNYQLATCGERIDIQQYGIEHNHCVDDNLMIRFAYEDKILMEFLKVDIIKIQPALFGIPEIPEGAIRIDDSTYAIKKKNNSDKGQRTFCGCMISKDIGEYNTCPHLCEYCYANANKLSAKTNYRQHQNNPLSETITGK